MLNAASRFIALFASFTLYLCNFSQAQSPAAPAQSGDAYEYINYLTSDKTDLKTRLDKLPGVLKCTRYNPPTLTEKDFRDRALTERLLNIQIATKVFRVQAIFFMLQGDREKALQTLASIYRMGQFMSQNGMMIYRLIGIALRPIATSGIHIYALNCCETPEDFTNFWKTMELLNKEERNLTAENILASEPGLKDNPNLKELLIRDKISAAKFHLVRTAAAGKLRLIQAGSYPTKAEEFAPLLPQGPAIDPFTSSPLRFLSKNPGQFICYSVGPDKKDDKGAIIYDATNGSTSSGDIVAEVPSQREFPFPRNGVKAGNREDLLKQFPKGLPADPFADTRNRSLGIAQSTPVMIYSFGPDTNQMEADEKGNGYVPAVAYDPTNGSRSQGDLILRIEK